MWLNFGFKHKLVQVSEWIMSYDMETKRIIKFISRYCHTDSYILDVGCGYGRNIKTLHSFGFDRVMGVEKNLKIVKAVCEEGYNCLSLDEFVKLNIQFDVVLISHVIEHYSPDSLLNFIDTYLDRLLPGGILIIATPVIGKIFYDDFDHIKPYMPTGIIHVFGKSTAQVQYYSRNKIELIDLWFRRGFHKITYHKGAYIKSPSTLLIRFINIFNALIFRISFGFYGKVDGWVGVFKKC
jgi:2-polyprenyl-3-methyl-5-hydroxy-6-metoxy-1,4-benzoquinol methylase